MIRTKYLNIDTRFYASKCGFAEYYVEIPQCIRGVTSLSIATVAIFLDGLDFSFCIQLECESSL